MESLKISHLPRLKSRILGQLPKYHLFNKPRCQASDVYIFSFLVEMWSAIVDRHKYKQQFYFNLTANSDNLSFSKSFYIVVKLLFWRQEIPSIRRFSLIARCFISLCNKREHDSSNLHEVFLLSVMTSCILLPSMFISIISFCSVFKKIYKVIFSNATRTMDYFPTNARRKQGLQEQLCLRAWVRLEMKQKRAWNIHCVR